MLTGEDCSLNQFFSKMFCLHAHSQSWTSWRIPGTPMLRGSGSMKHVLPFCTFVRSTWTGYLSYWYFWGSELSFRCLCTWIGMFIWVPSQRIAIALALQLTNSYLLHEPFFLPIWSFLYSGCSILNRHLVLGASVLLPCILHRIFPAVY